MTYKSALGLLVLVSSVACSTNGGVGPYGGTDSGTDGGTDAGGTDAAADAATDAATIQTVTLSEKEYAFTPSTVTLHGAGVYAFTVTNDGTMDHSLSITDNGVSATLPNSVSPGQSATLQVTLAVGTYTFFCPIDGHRQLGMQGTITVSAQ